MLFPRRFRQENFMERLPVSDEQFLQAIQLNGKFSKTFIRCCRLTLGEVFQVDPNKIYPTDTWRDVYNLRCADWDLLKIVLSLEETLGIEIDEDQVPIPTSKQQLGTWIAEFIARCS